MTPRVYARHRTAGEMTTEVASAFAFHDSPAGRILRATTMAFVPHLFTTREIGARGDSARADYGRIAAAIGVGEADIVTVKQVHGRSVLVVKAGEMVGEDESADAIVSTDPSRAIAVRVADCVPVLLADRAPATSARMRRLRRCCWCRGRDARAGNSRRPSSTRWYGRR